MTGKVTTLDSLYFGCKYSPTDYVHVRLTSGIDETKSLSLTNHVHVMCVMSCYQFASMGGGLGVFLLDRS